MKFIKKIPSKIEICPIVETIVEVKFTPVVDKSAVFGILYDKLREKGYNKVDKLPILDLPENLINNDPNLKGRPLYQLPKNNLLCQIGPEVFSTVGFAPYIGWKSFSEEIFSNLIILKNSNTVKKIDRVGIRYINLLESIHLNEIELSIKINDEDLASEDITLITPISKDDFICRVLLMGNAKKEKNNVFSSGTLIDIDAGFSGSYENAFENIEEIINRGHKVEKEIFFNLLNNELIQKLKPIYNY